MPPSLQTGRSRPAATLAAVGLVLLTAVATGFSALWRYEFRAGAPAATTGRWPAHASLALDPARPNLVLFAHPRCPCTRATIGELDRLAAQAGDRLRIAVLFLADAGRGASWTHTDLWNHAARIPGVEVLEDSGGAVAASFGARTSGQALLFSAGGELLFEGGITASRGHSGDNPGVAAILAHVLGQDPRGCSTPVFGCSLVTEAAPGGTGNGS